MDPRAALWLARAGAWSLLLGGWLVFGSLGLFWAPRAEWAFAPLALWMAGIGLVLRASRSLAFSPASGAAALLASAAGTVAGLWAAMQGGGWLALLAAAPCFSMLLVAASRTVRGLRPGAAAWRNSPAGPALAGALAVALLFRDPANPQAVASAAVALMIAAACLLALLPGLAGATGRRPGSGIASAQGCRPALFDCSLPGLAPWRGAGAARLVMLPMMSTLSWTLAWCQGTVMPPQGMLALHLAAMFLPAFLLWLVPARASGAGRGTVAACLMVAGALALFDADPLRALLWASLLQGVAWSLAWSSLLVPPARHRTNPLLRTTPRPAPSGLAGALLNAALVFALGAALGRFGLPALLAVHAALGLWAVVGLRPVRPAPSVVVSAQR